MVRKILIVIVALIVSTAARAECKFDLEVGDSLVFSETSISVPAACETVTINLKHTGSLPVSAMGHNWVLSTEADLNGIATDGIASGVDGNYLPVDDARVLAATKLIGGGESTSVTFAAAVLETGTPYTYFCSFPGHWAIMKGTLTRG